MTQEIQVHNPDAAGNRTVRYNSIRGDEVSLNIKVVQELFCKAATAGEAFGFIRFCQAHNLNPFLKDAYLVKYHQNDPAQLLVAGHVWLQIAERHPRFRGLKCGIILLDKDGGVIRRESIFYLPEEVVVGGWAEIFIEGREDVRVEVPVSEYQTKTREGKVTKFWAEKPATMIQKVALTHACRLAFPGGFAGMNGGEEMGHAPQDDSLDTITIDGDTGEITDYPNNRQAEQETEQETAAYSPPAAPEPAPAPAEAPKARQPRQGVPPRGRTTNGPSRAANPPANNDDKWGQVQELVAMGAQTTWERFLADILHFPKIEDYEQVGGTPEMAVAAYLAYYGHSAQEDADPGLAVCPQHDVDYPANQTCPECLTVASTASDEAFANL